MFTSKLRRGGAWDRWDFVALALGVFTAVWVFALKLKTFYDLGYSGDLFVETQLARSWLEGRGVASGQLVWELPCYSHLLFASPARTYSKAVRRSRLAIRARRVR